jgi:ParB-like chromosome segregation protein Spo0J
MRGMPPRQRRTAATKLADLAIEQVPIDQLKPDPDNARVHNDRNLAAVEASLRRFGQRKPLVVAKDYTVVAGNGTLEVMARVGMDQVWVSVFPGTPAEARAYGIADNRTGELASWDPERLLENLATFDAALLEATGYAPDDLADLAERFGAAPSLDELTGELGSPEERLLWPVLRVQMPKDLLDRYNALVDHMDGGDDVARFEQVVKWAEEYRVGMP